MAVIKDVAKKAGVSIGTVSKFFNHPQLLRPETYQRVLEAVEALDYRPSAIARSMRTGRTNIVAVLVPEISNPFYAQGYSLLASALHQNSFVPLLITTEANPVFDDFSKLSLLLSHADAAILYLLDNALVNRLLPFFNEQKLANIVVSQREENVPWNIVIEETQGMRAATQHLLDLHRRSICFIGGPVGDLMTDDKLLGFQQALEASNLRAHSILRCKNFAPEEAHLMLKALIQNPNDTPPPDAYCCANDSLALGALKCLVERGYRVPEDAAIIGFDDLPLCVLSQPELSSVALPLEAIAIHVSEMISPAVNNPLASTPPIFLSTQVIARASSAQTP